MNLCLSYFLRGQNRSKIFCFIKQREPLLLYLNPDGRRGGLHPSPLCLQFQNPFVTVSLRPVLGTVTAHFMGTVWSLCS